MRLLPLLLLISLCTSVRAQTTPPTYNGQLKERNAATLALGLEDALTIDQLMVYIPGIGSPARENLMRQNIKSYMMPVRQVTDPKLEWAYALADCLEYYVNLNSNYKDNMSPDYVALNLAAAGKRPTLVDGLRMLAREGTVTAAIVPYGSATIPPAVYSVERKQITNYGQLFHPETRPRNRIFEVRKALSRGNPVLVEISTDAAFLGTQTQRYTTPQPGAETHYLTVVGYDEEDELFELRGSYGRLWADAGYVRLSYDDFGRLTRRGYVLIPK